jgi:predicted pyridoxine 5'-phosphate oxidase superfamily flavin-nucleotide-binding protein
MTHAIETTEQLAALFGQPGEASLKKEVQYLHPAYQALIAASPFAVLATCGPGGLDASPRGDAPGFVMVQDEKTLLLPERRGNNRIDSLRNIVGDPRVASCRRGPMRRSTAQPTTANCRHGSAPPCTSG